MRFKKWLQAAIVVSVAALSQVTWADGSIGNKDTTITTGSEKAELGNGCQSAGMFSTKMLTNMCWDCVLPIIVGAIPIKTSMVTGGFSAGVPDGAASVKYTSSMCMCRDNNGVPSLGIRTSLWEPFRLVEFERMPGCSSVLNGIRFPFDKLNFGTDESEQAANAKNGEHQGHTMKHYHYYSYPIMTMLDMWVPRNCNPGFYMDLDVMYMSEIDPTWNYDEIAFFTHPEAALIASPLGVVACLPDVFMSQLDKPVNELYWCAGSWGVIFPTTGNTGEHVSLVDAASLFSVRVLYALHRRGMEWKTIGKDAMCGGSLVSYLPKTQYRFSMFHPVAETSSNHAMGAMSLVWGFARIIPMTGEDPVFVIWRWLDCCNTSTGS